MVDLKQATITGLNGTVTDTFGEDEVAKNVTELSNMTDTQVGPAQEDNVSFEKDALRTMRDLAVDGIDEFKDLNQAKQFVQAFGESGQKVKIEDKGSKYEGQSFVVKNQYDEQGRLVKFNMQLVEADQKQVKTAETKAFFDKNLAVDTSGKHSVKGKKAKVDNNDPDIFSKDGSVDGLKFNVGVTEDKQKEAVFAKSYEVGKSDHGLSDESARLYAKYLTDQNGDPDKTLTALKDNYKNKGVEGKDFVAKHFGTPKDIIRLRALGTNPSEDQVKSFDQAYAQTLAAYDDSALYAKAYNPNAGWNDRSGFQKATFGENLPEKIAEDKSRFDPNKVEKEIVEKYRGQWPDVERVAKAYEDGARDKVDAAMAKKHAFQAQLKAVETMEPAEREKLMKHAGAINGELALAQQELKNVSNVVDEAIRTGNFEKVNGALPKEQQFNIDADAQKGIQEVVKKKADKEAEEAKIKADKEGVAATASEFWKNTTGVFGALNQIAGAPTAVLGTINGLTEAVRKFQGGGSDRTSEMISGVKDLLKDGNKLAAKERKAPKEFVKYDAFKGGKQEGRGQQNSARATLAKGGATAGTGGEGQGVENYLAKKQPNQNQNDPRDPRNQLAWQRAQRNLYREV